MKKAIVLVILLSSLQIANNSNAQEVKINENFVIESDGTQRLDGAATVWDDMFGDISKIKAKKDDVQLSESETSIDFTDDAELKNYAIVVFQMPHKWKYNTAIYPHLHWIQENGNTPNWLIRYRWQRNGQTATTDWTDYKCNTNALTYPGSGSFNQITHGDSISAPTGYGISDVIQFKIYRDTQHESTVYSANDPYSGTASITSFDYHYQIDTEGSRSEYVK